MNNNEWLDIDLLEDYLDGKLDAKAMHRVERISLEDPFVAEALAGLSLSPKRTQSLSLLQKQLQERIAQKPVEQKRWQITSQRLSIAAAAAVLFVTVSLLFWMRESSNREKIVANTPRKVEVAIAASKEPAKPIVKAKEEVEKVITKTKEHPYVARSGKLTKPVQNAEVAVAMATQIAPASESVVNKVNEAMSVKSAEANKRSEVYKKEVSSALAGRVAGVQINGNSINGVVYDENKLPISGASVKAKGASQGVVTDSKGQFSLALDSMLKDPKLNVVSLGFMSKEVIVKKDQDIAIELKPSNSTLNEVVIVGYGTAKKQISVGSSTTLVKSAEPVGGWDKFEEYMVNNNKLLLDKKATGRDIMVQFKINEKGKPINIKIVSNLNIIPKVTKAEENEAIRLVKNGPKWILPPNSSSLSVNTTVNIRF